MSERDYIIEKKSLEDQLEEIDRKLNEIEQNSGKHFTLSDEEFMAKASYFIISQQLQDKRFINFDSLVRKTGPKILKEFINSVIKKLSFWTVKSCQSASKTESSTIFFYKTL